MRQDKTQQPELPASSASDAYLPRLRSALAPVRARINLQCVGHEVARGLRWGSLLAIFLGLLRLATGGWLASGWCWWTLAGAAAVGAAWGLRHRVSFPEAATRVDRHHGWNDTLTTAWHVCCQPEPSAWGRQVLARAKPLLERISARRVAPLRCGRTAATTAVAVILAVALSVCPTIRLRSAATPPQPELPATAVVQVPPPQPTAEGSPVQVEASLRALDPPSMHDPAAEGRLAVLQDHVIVRDYFRRQAEDRSPPEP